MTRKIIISDIHGCLNEFIELLQMVQYEVGEDELILLGDYVDKGYDSKGVIQYLMELSQNQKVKILGGNHDSLFLLWLDEKEYKRMPYLKMKNGGINTILSFVPQYKEGFDENEIREWIKENYPNEISFIRNLPSYYEDESFIYVHAGIDPNLENWKETNEKDFRWIRGRFYQKEHKQNKTVIFGHTLTNTIKKNELDCGVWYGNKKIAIDGGCCFGYQLNALVIEGDERKEYCVKKK